MAGNLERKRGFATKILTELFSMLTRWVKIVTFLFKKKQRTFGFYWPRLLQDP